MPCEKGELCVVAIMKGTMDSIVLDSPLSMQMLVAIKVNVKRPEAMLKRRNRMSEKKLGKLPKFRRSIPALAFASFHITSLLFADSLHPILLWGFCTGSSKSSSIPLRSACVDASN